MGTRLKLVPLQSNDGRGNPMKSLARIKGQQSLLVRAATTKTKGVILLIFDLLQLGFLPARSIPTNHPTIFSFFNLVFVDAHSADVPSLGASLDLDFTVPEVIGRKHVVVGI
jgi:hypothetical protein